MFSNPLSLLLAASLTTALPATSPSLAVQAGQHVIWSWNGTTPPDSLKTAITKGLVGGVITFGENVNSDLPATIASLQSTWKASPNYNGVPLLITTDQEGGQVRRLPGGPTQSAKQIGSSSNPAAAASSAGTVAANVLKQYNHNGNLAPVLDVFRQSGDFDDQYQRSFSNNATIVGQCGAAWVKSQQAGGVAATVKHFPGLGPAARGQNTDAEPVTINLEKSEIRAVDEFPYQFAIEAGVDMVMTSWALYPKFDTKYPAGISRTIVQGELRQRLGFKGVTITDAIEANGLKGFGSDGQRAVLASKAGIDIILAAARSVPQGQGVVDALVGALQDGTLDKDEFDAATARILALRKKLA